MKSLLTIFRLHGSTSIPKTMASRVVASSSSSVLGPATPISSPATSSSTASSVVPSLPSSPEPIALRRPSVTPITAFVHSGQPALRAVLMSLGSSVPPSPTLRFMMFRPCRNMLSRDAPETPLLVPAVRVPACPLQPLLPEAMQSRVALIINAIFLEESTRP